MKKGKARTRNARCNLLKANERNARRKAKRYNHRDYDGNHGSEGTALEA